MALIYIRNGCDASNSFMKKKLITTLLSFAACPLLAQGLVNFFNNSTTLVSSGPPGQPAGGNPLVPSYFGLLTAAPGTTNPALFTFSGLYATNQPVNGRILGGASVPVVGWVPGTSRSFLIAGWSISLGHDWNPAWMHGDFSAQGFWGLSSIGTGIAGGSSGVSPIPLPPLNLFGGVNGVLAGWNLGPVTPVPEPSSLPLAALGVAAVLICRCRRMGPNRPAAAKPR
jgi:hypothetical protein